MNAEAKTTLSREQIEARAEELAEKEEITPEEFKEFVYHIWDLEPTEDGEDKFNGELVLPGPDNPQVTMIIGAPNENYAEVDFNDGLGEYTGEAIKLKVEDGKVNWHTGTLQSFYSEFLGKRVLSDAAYDNGPVLANEPLTPAELHKAATKIFDSYKQSKEQSVQQ